MESRLIYESSRIYFNKIIWTRPTDKSDTEWVYFGSGDEIDIELILKSINQCLTTNDVFLVLSKKDSIKVDRNEIKAKIVGLFNIIDFLLWDTNFNNIIEVSKIGVFRLGVKIS